LCAPPPSPPSSINNNDFKNNDLQAAANQSDYVSFNNHVLLTRSSEYFLSLVITYTLNVATELQKTLMGLDTDDQWFLTSLPEWDEGEEEVRMGSQRNEPS
jgi:hypothetical protein